MGGGGKKALEVEEKNEWISENGNTSLIQGLIFLG